ncbi:aldo/keto reductase [Agromyces sp. NBRC 114283]|uniref:aldo/keto reductase n=1 Tax=Agromyces sp. NBRC 114283 TaxID=2994521 RepID=UPI0024A56F1A|nr:aldo/keto reductase [Agromyces sp. NBRC 114283]GLU87772.1 oxidoreductase [Agromyces sp. NBRC 114283]
MTATAVPEPSVKRVPLGGTGLEVPNLLLGAMRIEDLDDAAIRELVDTARAAGISYIDHADIYGRELHGCERRFAEALRLSPAERDELTLQTKCGIVKGEAAFDFSYEHIVASVEGSLDALDTDRIDVLLLHRPDALVEPDEVARAFDELHAAGKVRAFGVSNHTPGQIELLQRSLDQPIVVNQIQLSLAHASAIAQGIAANMSDEQSVVRDGGGIVDYARLHGITLQAWAPFQGPAGVFLGSDQHAELNAVIDRIAGRYGVEPIAVATAWLTRHPAGIQVVLGTTKPARLAAAAQGSDLRLSRSEWYELFRAAGHIVP